MPRKHLLPFVLFVLAGALGAAGCGNDFSPYNRLNSLRVLAMRSDPVAPAPGETTTLSVLTYTPKPDPTMTFAWSWCPFAGSANDGYPCLVTEAQIAQLGTQTAVPSFDLGTGATATFTHSINPALLQSLCAGVANEPIIPDCEGGFPIQIKLVVKTATDEVVSVNTLRLRLDTAGSPNTNPTITGITAAVAGTDTVITDTPTVTLPRHVKTVIKGVVTDAQSETYVGKNDNDMQATLRERLVLTWFIESGDTDSPQTSFISGLVPLDRALMNKWEPARTKDYAPSTSRLIVVLRDNRGGVSWTSAAVNLEPKP